MTIKTFWIAAQACPPYKNTTGQALHALSRGPCRNDTQNLPLTQTISPPLLPQSKPHNHPQNGKYRKDHKHPLIRIEGSQIRIKEKL